MDRHSDRQMDTQMFTCSPHMCLHLHLHMHMHDKDRETLSIFLLSTCARTCTCSCSCTHEDRHFGLGWGAHTIMICEVLSSFQIFLRGAQDECGNSKHDVEQFQKCNYSCDEACTWRLQPSRHNCSRPDKPLGESSSSIEKGSMSIYIPNCATKTHVNKN